MAIIIMMKNTPANNDQNLLELLSKQSCRLGLELLDRTVAGEAAKQEHLLKMDFLSKSVPRVELDRPGEAQA